MTELKIESHWILLIQNMTIVALVLLLVLSFHLFESDLVLYVAYKRQYEMQLSFYNYTIKLNNYCQM